MKVIIEKDGIKRQVEGGFHICMSAQDAAIIAEKLFAFAQSDATYGWVFIADEAKRVPNLEPLDWQTR